MGTDMKGYEVAYKGRVYPALEMHMIRKDSMGQEEGKSGFMPAPTFLDVLVINEDGEPRIINDETHMFRFMRIKAKGEAYEHARLHKIRGMGVGGSNGGESAKRLYSLPVFLP